MKTVTVRIYSNENDEEKIVIIDEKYLELLKMISRLIGDDYLFNYSIVNVLEITDFTK